MTSIGSGTDPGLIIRGAEYHSTTFNGPQGGLIDLARIVFTLNTDVVSPVQLISTSSSDVGQVYRVEGVSDFNLLVTDEVVLNGTTPVETVEDFAYIERIVKVDGPVLVGEVIISTNARDLGSLQAQNGPLPEVTEILNLLADVPSNPEIEKVIFEKFFLYNPNDYSISFELREQSDPGSCVTFALDPANNDDVTSMARDLRPMELTYEKFTSLPKTATLGSGESRGIWLRVRLDAGSLVSSKRYQMKLIETATSLNRESIITLIGRHAGGNGIAQPLSIRSSFPIGGGNPLQFVELRGAKMVAELAYEPDPVTFRDQFYYNTRINQLFRKIPSSPRPVWKSAL